VYGLAGLAAVAASAVRFVGALELVTDAVIVVFDVLAPAIAQ